MKLFIRMAKKEDLPEILNFVNALAVYEKEPDAVTATIRDYEQAFAENIFQSHIAEADGKIVGMTVFYITWSTWKGKMLYLEDFIVKEEYRRFGIGQKLFDAFLDEAKKRECKLTKWQVLDWNEPALKFYEKNSATIERDWWNGKVIF